MEPIDQIPGVTFRLEKARQLPPPPNEGCIAGGEVVLRAVIHDLDLWDQVVRQLQMLRIYTVKNLAEQMVAVSQRKAKEAEDKLMRTQSTSGVELETLRQRVSFLEYENRQLREANQKWAEWAHSPAAGR